MRVGNYFYCSQKNKFYPSNHNYCGINTIFIVYDQNGNSQPFMRNIFYILLMLVCLGCSAGKVSRSNQQVAVITDPAFANGISVIGSNSSQPNVTDTIYPFGKTKGKPSWRVVQWASRFVLSGDKPVVNDDTVIYQNAGKRITFLKKGRHTTVGLEVKGSAEYISPRKNNQSWPHLLLEQQYAAPISLSHVQHLNYSIQAKLLYATDHLGNAFDKGLHTAQINLFISIQNLNPNSAGYRDYFWFGLPLYDYRYPEIAPYDAQDMGKDDATKKFISAVSSAELYAGTMHNKQWIAINKDVYPMLVKAFNTAQQRGFLKGSKLSDMAIGEMNVGWEIPGTYDAGILIKDLKLTAGLK